MKKWTKKPKHEREAYHEKIVEDRFAAYELTDSPNFDNRQKAKNVLRYQLRGYCFELPPTCARYGKCCLNCSHVRCRENEMYDGEKWDYDFDPDINRFSTLFDNLQDLANSSSNDIMPIANELPQKVDTQQSLTSLLATLAGEAKSTAF
jgi:hypothetical protein